MPSRLLLKAGLCLTLISGSTACGYGKSVGFPSRADVSAVTEHKPVPTDDIVTDPKASALYNASVESWGDRVSAAGRRLCRFFKARGMAVDCPER